MTFTCQATLYSKILVHFSNPHLIQSTYLYYTIIITYKIFEYNRCIYYLNQLHSDLLCGSMKFAIQYNRNTLFLYFATVEAVLIWHFAFFSFNKGIG